MHIKSSTYNTGLLCVLAILLIGGLIGNGFILMSHASKGDPVHIAT